MTRAKHKMYKNFIFDLYGTLIDLKTDENKDELWENLANFYSKNGALYTKKELKKKYISECKSEISKNKISKYPDIKIEKVFEKLYLLKNITAEKILIDETAILFRKLSTDYINIYPGVIELLEYIKSRGSKIILLSNAQRIFTVYEMESMGIIKYFDALYISSDIEISKPDVKFYEIMAINEKINKKESLMIGNDHTTDIKGAVDFGIDSVYIHSNYSRKEAVDCKNGIYFEKINIKSTYKVLDGDIYKLLKVIKDIYL